MMSEEFVGTSTYGSLAKKITDPSTGEKPSAHADSMAMLRNLTELDEWLARHGNPSCKRPARYPAYATMLGRKPAVYGLIQFNANTQPDIQLWRLISNYLYRCKVDANRNLRIVLKVAVMNAREGKDVNRNYAKELDLDVTHLLVDLLSPAPKYCFHPQRFMEAIPDLGHYADLSKWNWRLGLEIVPAR